MKNIYAQCKPFAGTFLLFCLAFFVGCGGGSSSNSVSSPPPSSPPNNPASQPEDFLYQVGATGIAVSPLSLSTGILEAPVDAVDVPGFQPDLTVAPVSASGQFIYFIGLDGEPPSGLPISPGVAVEAVYSFSINQSTGLLSALPNSPFIESTNDASFLLGPPNGMVADPQGKFIYVSYYNGSIYLIRELTIGSGTGELQDGVLIQPFSPWLTVQAIDPAAKYLYAATYLSSRLAISVFAINPQSGAPQEISGSPFTVLGSGSSEYNLNVFTGSSGKFVYATVISPNLTISSPGLFVFSVDPTSGALTLVPGSPFAIGTLPVNAWVSPDGNFVYVLEAANMSTVTGISVFPIDATTGAVASTPSSSVPLNNFGKPLFDPEQQFMLFTDTSSTAINFSIDNSTGALTTVPGSPFNVTPLWYSATIVRNSIQ